MYNRHVIEYKLN